MAIRLNGLAQYNEPVGRDYVDILRFGVAPVVRVGHRARRPWSPASYYYYYENNQPDRGIPIVTFPGQIGGPPDVDPSNYYGLVQQDEETVHLHRGTLTVRPQVQREHRGPQHLPVPVVGPHCRRSRRAASCSPSTAGPAARVDRGRPATARAATRASRSSPTRREALFKFETWMLKHKLVGGVDVAHQTYDRQTLTLTPGPNTSLTNPNPFPPGIFTTTNGARFDADATSVGRCTSIDDIQILSWLKFMAGSRFDNFNSEVTNFNADRLVASRFSRVDQFWSPARRARRRSPRARRPTTSRGAARSTRRPSTLNSINVANQGTPPEQTDSYELGRQARLLQQRARRHRRALPHRQVRRAHRRSHHRHRHARRQRAVAGPRARASSAGPLPEWNICLGSRILDTEILAGVRGGHPGQGARQRPEQHAVAVDDVRLPHRSGRRARGVFYSSSRFGNNTNTSEVPGYVRWDLTRRLPGHPERRASGSTSRT